MMKDEKTITFEKHLVNLVSSYFEKWMRFSNAINFINQFLDSFLTLTFQWRITNYR